MASHSHKDAINRNKDLVSLNDQQQVSIDSNAVTDLEQIKPDSANESILGFGDFQFYALFEAALDAMVIADDQGRYVAANQAACELFGTTREDLLGRCIADFAPSGFELDVAWQEFQQHGQERGEFSLTRPDGTVREVEYAATANFIPHCHLSVLRDVTERKQLERQLHQLNRELELQVAERTAELQQTNTELQAVNQQLQASQQKYQTLFNILPIGVTITDAAGQILEANPASKRILGVPTETPPPRSFDESRRIICPDGSLMPIEEYASVRALQENRRIEGQEQGVVNPDGTVHWLYVNAAPIPLDNYGVATAYVDITDRKQSELLLRESEARFVAAFQSSPDAIMITRLSDGLILNVNHRFGEISGYTKTEAIGQTTLKLPIWVNQAQRDMVITRLQADKSIQDYEFCFRRKSGETFIGLFSCQVIDFGGQPCGLSVIRDITDRKLAEAERDMAEAALRQREQEFRTLVENSPDAIVRVDRQFRLVYVNPIVMRAINTPPTQLLSKTIRDLDFPKTLVNLWVKTIKQVFLTGQEKGIEFDFPVPEGKPFTFYARLVPELDDDGSVVSILGIARDITALKQAQKALLYQSEREYSLRLITQHMRETLDIDAILEAAVTEIQRVLQADRTLIFQLHSGRSGVVIQEVVRPEYPMTLKMRWEDECFPLECYSAYCQGNARIVADVAFDQWGECLVEFMQEMGVQSKIVAPITQPQEDGTMRLWGLLIVHACRERRVWHQDEADLLQQVAEQLAIALQQAELYNQVQQLNTNLEEQVHDRTADLQRSLEFEMLLKRITDQVRDSLDEDQILETVVRELGHGLQLECSDTGIYDADLTTSTIAHEFTQSLTSIKGITFPVAQSTHAEIYPFIFQGQILQFCDRMPCSLRHNPTQLTILVCPIMDDQRVLGDMWLYKHHSFSSSEVRLVEQVANQCGIALRQSRLYQAAQAQVRELERLNQLKDDFLSTVSHELRTPMSNIKMATQMLELSLNRLGILADTSIPVYRYFKVLQEEGQREITLINDLLDLTRLDAGTEPLNLTKVTLQAYIPHLAESFVERTRQQQQQLILQISSDLPVIMTDEPYLERILTELLQNACKYTPPQERITIAAQALPNAIEIRVSNSGIEIPTSEHDRIFDKFYRIPNNDPWKYGGTGLGLALVKKLTERIRGTIHVESGNGQTSFIVEIWDFSESP